MRELEADNQRLREEAAALAEQLAAKEHELLQLSACRRGGRPQAEPRAQPVRAAAAGRLAGGLRGGAGQVGGVRQLGDDLEGKLRDSRAEVAELEQQNSELAATVDRLGGGLPRPGAGARGRRQAAAARGRQTPAAGRGRARRADGHSLAARLRASAELAEGRAQGAEEGRALLEEAYRRIEQMERGLEEARAQLAGEQQRHQQQKQEIRAEYESSIAQLVRVAAQLEAESRAKQDRASQLGGGGGEGWPGCSWPCRTWAAGCSPPRRPRPPDGPAGGGRGPEVPARRGGAELPRQVRGAGAAARGGHRHLQQLAAAKEELRKCADRFHSYEKELCGAAVRPEAARVPAQGRRPGEERRGPGAQAQGAARRDQPEDARAGRPRHQEPGPRGGGRAPKRQAAIDSARQEARLHELERMLREKRDFEMKVTQLYV